MSSLRLREFAAALVVPLVFGGTAGAVIALPMVPFQAQFQAIAGDRWIDRASQIKAESRFEWGVTAPDGGMGGAQAMPKTWEWAIKMGMVPKGASPYDPVSAIAFNHHYMNYLEPRAGGSDRGLGAYNAGIGNELKAVAIAARLGLPGEDAWLDALPRVTGAKNAGITRNYVRRNRANRTEYRRLVGRAE